MHAFARLCGLQVGGLPFLSCKEAALAHLTYPAHNETHGEPATRGALLSLQGCLMEFCFQYILGGYRPSRSAICFKIIS